MSKTDRIRELEQMNATQCETIGNLWTQNASLERRISKLQPIADWRQNRIDELERQLSPLGQAAQVFKRAGQ